MTTRPRSIPCKRIVTYTSCHLMRNICRSSDHVIKLTPTSLKPWKKNSNPNTGQLEQRHQKCEDTILNIHNLGNGVPADPQDKTCQDRPAYTSIRCAAWTKRNKHAPQPARLDTSGPLLQWLHLIRAYSYPDLGIVGSSHLCYDFSHKIRRIGMKEILGGTIQECCLVLVLPSLEVAHRPTSRCISAGIEHNRM